MDILTASEIRRAIVNGSRREVSDMVVPAGLDAVDWENLDFLGWRDFKAPLRGYIIYRLDKELVGIILRAAETASSRRKNAMCQLCRAPRPSDEVTLFAARRAGHAGRDMNTVGTYFCTDLTCSDHVRIAPPRTPLCPDPTIVMQQHIAGLNTRMGAFIASVLRGSGDDVARSRLIANQQF
jgi:hypothetical protein